MDSITKHPLTYSQPYSHECLIGSWQAVVHTWQVLDFLLVLEELPHVIDTLKQAYAAAQRFETAIETTPPSRQARQAAAQIGIDALYIVGVFLLDADLMGMWGRVHQLSIHPAAIACVLPGFGAGIHQALCHLPGE